MQQSRRAWGTFRIAVAFAVVFVSAVAAVNLVPLLLGEARNEALCSIGYTVGPFITMVVSLWRRRICSGPERLLWTMIFTANLLWTVGAGIVAVWIGIAGSVPYPGPADGLFLIAFVCALVGVSRVAAVRSWPYVIDGALVAGSLLFATWVPVLDPLYDANKGDLLRVAVSLQPPVFDIILISVAFLALARKTGAQVWSLRLIAPALICQAVGDLIFAYDLAPSLPGPLTLICFAMSTMLLLLAALAPRSDGQAVKETRLTRGYVMAPYLPPFLAAVVAAYFVITELQGHVAMWMLAIALVLLTLGRQLYAMLVNVALTDQLAVTVEQLKNREQELAFLALHDPLTSLPNRRMLRRSAEDHAANTSTSLTVVMIDLDGFKNVNDTFGHDVGDALLVRVAGRLLDCVRGGDLVARVGGDEFSILLPGATTQAAMLVARRIAEAIAEPFDIDGQFVTVGASVGVAPSSTEVVIEDLFRSADAAMYERKRSGKGGVGLVLTAPADAC